tara:strand:- start:2500 stop:2619 length:120 start_codon:yes stop_codon:yes gene_type:complete
LQVVDVNLARKEIGDVAILTKLEEKSQEIKLEKLRMAKA